MDITVVSIARPTVYTIASKPQEARFLHAPMDYGSQSYLWRILLKL